MEKRKQSKKEKRQELKEKLEDERMAQILQKVRENQSKIIPTPMTCAEDVENYFHQATEGISQQELDKMAKIKADRLIKQWEPLLDELLILDLGLRNEKDISYNVHEALTYTPEQHEYTSTLINSIAILDTMRRGIMLTLQNLKGTNSYKRDLAIICSAERRDQLKILLGNLKKVGIAIDTKQVEEFLSGIDKVVEGQENFLL